MAYRAQIQVETAAAVRRFSGDIPAQYAGLTSQFLPTKYEAEAWLAGAVEFARELGLPVMVMQVTWDPGECGSSAVSYSPYVMDERPLCSCDDEGCTMCSGFCEGRAVVDGRYCYDCNPMRR